MNYRSKVRYSQLAIGLAIAIASAPAFAQTTSANIGGRVTGAGDAAVSGAQITITHLPSGTASQAVSDASGRYAARGLRVGGPYRVTITKDGKTETIDNVFLQLAETTQVDASFEDATTLEAVEVTAANVGYSPFSSSAVGAGTSVTREQLDTFASIQRNLQDYARLDPRISQTDKERGEISAGGQNTRFNTITIDGVNTSDTFGLEANSLPTAKQPISIDAIEEVQVNISNYDVAQRGYTGANINAVTKSGTNDFRGSVYYVFRNDKMAGDRYVAATDSYVAPPKSQDKTSGFTLGGPILKDRLFFFASAENYESTRLGTEFSPLGGSGTQVFITQTELDAIRNIMQTRYGVDIGGTTPPANTILDVKDRLLKLDWNISDNHRANIRYNKTDESTPIFPGFGTRSLSLSSHWYAQEKTFESLVGQWFADWSDTFSTEFRASRRDYDSVPLNNSNLPQVTVQINGGTAPPGVLGGTRTVLFGTERSRHFNVLQTETVDAYFGGTWTLGAHELKFGVDRSENDVYNAFL
ncbi:MAG: carboxypeptidase regulatory-like domain-containing protein, partial [Lysobacteraceae bacterium]